MSREEKEACVPPLCLHGGCYEACFHYCEATGFVGDYYGKFCPKHRAENAARTRRNSAKRRSCTSSFKRRFP